MASPEPWSLDPARRSPASSPSSIKGHTASDFPRSSGNRESESSSRMTVDGLIRTASTSTPPSESTPLGTQVTRADPPAAPRRTVDDVWREIVSGERRVCKEEVPDEEMMTLEDFLVRAGASVGEDEEVEVKDVRVVQPLPPQPPAHQLSGSMFAIEPKVEPSMIGFGNGAEVIGGGGSGLRGKRGPPLLEPLDRAAQQRQRRMIKNRESAARSRERKQAYQIELEALAVKLEEENELLLKEKAERTRERRKQLMERVVPIVEKPKSARALRRVRSMQW
ncbi:G-box-binding factor 4-like [Punica granatum]|uniref:BZIP domain-containing protein n=2 Tax=Punica granatum TaxID=22663 RepID=A0A218XJU1_PUNGR|nr:G-box-binding factor 4-like [Punica granatum]OWM85040.1 hypothetical protein CDL15_Pgr027827 [Punica granatum]PKI57427.1 hypothetical protein CRG98_022078 [Punica granatum]